MMIFAPDEAVRMWTMEFWERKSGAAYFGQKEKLTRVA